MGRNIFQSQIATRVEWLTIKPLKAFLSLIRNRPSKEVILICLISGSNLLLKKEERGREPCEGWRYQGLLWMLFTVWMIFFSVYRLYRRMAGGSLDADRVLSGVFLSDEKGPVGTSAQQVFSRSAIHVPCKPRSRMTLKVYLYLKESPSLENLFILFH